MDCFFFACISFTNSVMHHGRGGMSAHKHLSNQHQSASLWPSHKVMYASAKLILPVEGIFIDITILHTKTNCCLIHHQHTFPLIMITKNNLHILDARAQELHSKCFRSKISFLFTHLPSLLLLYTYTAEHVDHKPNLAHAHLPGWVTQTRFVYLHNSK